MARASHIAFFLFPETIQQHANCAIQYQELLVSAQADFARARSPCGYSADISSVREDTRAIVMAHLPAPPPNIPDDSSAKAVSPRNRGNRGNAGTPHQESTSKDYHPQKAK